MESALTETQILLLGGAALLTSILSAIVGMAGGITLLTVMLLFMDPLEAIPIHGVIQLVSNGSRTLIQRQYVRWEIIARYAVLLVPAGFLGLALAQQLPPQAMKAVIGAFVLIATWVPWWLTFGRHPEEIDPRRRFLVLGGVVGVLNMAVGATGPLIAPFFLNLGLTRFALIGTKAACQTLGHLTKIAIFGLAGFAFADHLGLIAVMFPAVIVGTWVGSRMLHAITETWFIRLYKGVLSVIALRLLIPW